VTAIEGQIARPRLERGQGQQMGVDQIADMDIVANAGAVRRRIIFAVNAQFGQNAGGNLNCALDQMARLFNTARPSGSAPDTLK
jgi:hypothetical protein